jgi:hypothetical protein
MLRFSLLTLLGVVLVAGIGSAALANPTDTWRQVVVTGTVVILLVAILFTVSKRPVSRFALGFAVTGWLYLVLTFDYLSSQLGLSCADVFPISYDISPHAEGADAVIRGTIEVEPRDRLSDEDRMDLIFED